nr:hypothetical protein CFP56_63602 [Quercus suber]
MHTVRGWVVTRRKQGTKIRRGSGGESDRTHDNKLQDREDVGNETRSETNMGKTAPFIDSSREGKRKLSPLRVPTGLQLSEVVQNIKKGSTSLDLSVAGPGLKTKAQTYPITKQGPLKTKVNPISKGNNVIGRNRVFKASFKTTFDEAASSSSSKIQFPITHEDDKLEQRAPVEFQLTTGPWPEVGYKFGGHGGEDTRSGKGRNCVEVCFSIDDDECQRRHDVNDWTQHGKKLSIHGGTLSSMSQPQWKSEE